MKQLCVSGDVEVQLTVHVEVDGVPQGGADVVVLHHTCELGVQVRSGGKYIKSLSRNKAKVCRNPQVTNICLKIAPGEVGHRQ